MPADVAERQEHAVAVVDRERNRSLVDDTHESGITALVRTLRVPVAVAGREEEHVTRFDELPGVVVHRVADEQLVDAVRDAPSLKTILPEAVVVVERAHAHGRHRRASYWSSYTGFTIASRPRCSMAIPSTQSSEPICTPS